MKWSISTLTLSKVNLLDLTFPQVLVKRTTGVKFRPSAIAIAEFQFPWWQHSIATSIRWSITFAAFEVFDARHTWVAVKAERELNLKFNVISCHIGSFWVKVGWYGSKIYQKLTSQPSNLMHFSTSLRWNLQWQLISNDFLRYESVVMPFWRQKSSSQTVSIWVTSLRIASWNKCEFSLRFWRF